MFPMTSHADLLYDLAGQTVRHFRTYLSEEDTKKVLRFHQRRIADFVHSQMQSHFWEDEGVEYEVKISKGFSELKPSAYSAAGRIRLRISGSHLKTRAIWLSISLAGSSGASIQCKNFTPTRNGFSRLFSIAKRKSGSSRPRASF